MYLKAAEAIVFGIFLYRYHNVCKNGTTIFCFVCILYSEAHIINTKTDKWQTKQTGTEACKKTIEK